MIGHMDIRVGQGFDVHALAEGLKGLYPNEKFHFIMGVMADKDYNYIAWNQKEAAKYHTPLLEAFLKTYTL